MFSAGVSNLFYQLKPGEQNQVTTELNRTESLSFVQYLYAACLLCLFIQYSGGSRGLMVREADW